MTSSALRSAAPLSIRSFSANLCKGLGLVQTRFVQQMIVGIHRTQSLHLTDIARSLGEGIALHATHKRLSRNLARKDLTGFISNALLQRATRDVTQDMMLVVNHYSLSKRFATRMEYIRGADKSSLDDGYHVCDISGVDPSSPDCYIPLLSRLWSRHAPDYHSDASEILSAVNQVYSATEGRGVFYCKDTSIPDHIILDLIHQPNLRTMLRIDNRETAFNFIRQLFPPGTISYNELPHGKLMFKLVTADVANQRMGRKDNEPVEVSLFLEFGGWSVQLPGSGKPATIILTRNPPDQYRTALNNAFLTTGSKANKSEQLWSLILNQFLAQKVANAAIDHKSRFNQSDFRVLTYDRLQLLNVLLQAVSHYEAYIEGTFRLEDQSITAQPHRGKHPRDFMVPTEISL